ncbi:MAG: winged helix-turn-helix transcriptional regulator, partial [Firmicutes bacterium]|nr:winged helix-turn-helix transcriptional regulator [Bacillota bacterium]
LARKEAVLAEVLMQMAPRAVSREILMEKLWDDQTFIDENTLNVNVARLRKKLQEIGVEKALETVRGYGYRLNVSWRNE